MTVSSSRQIKSVEMGRFDGKPVLSVSVSDGINKPKELIEQIRSGSVPIYHHKGAKAAVESGADQSFSRQIYKHLMNGVFSYAAVSWWRRDFHALAFLLDTVGAWIRRRLGARSAP